MPERDDFATSPQNVGKYGPKLLGDEEYERQQKAKKESGGPMSKFGPKALADHGAEAEEAVEAAQEELSPRERLKAALEELPLDYEVEGGKGGYYTLIGPDGEKIEGPTDSGKWGPGPGEVLAAARQDYEDRVKQEETDEEAGPDQQLSVDEIRGVLDKNPAKVDELMHLEFRRSEGPRLEALQVLHAHEADSEDPRPEVLSTLDGAMADLSQPDEDGEEAA